MKRYTMTSFLEYDTPGEPLPCVEHRECDDGDWVRYDDAQAEIDRLRADLDRLLAAAKRACREVGCTRGMDVMLQLGYVVRSFQPTHGLGP